MKKMITEAALREELVSKGLSHISSAVPKGAAIANELFTGAPLHFLERHSPQTLASVVGLAVNVVGNVSKASDQVVTESLVTSGVTMIAVALKDRPFIVNTLLEVCRELRLTCLAVLHPVLSTNSPAISLNIIELEGATEKDRASLEMVLKDALSSLIPATDDFAAMTTAVNNAVAKETNSNSKALAQWLTEGGFNVFGYAFISKAQKLTQELGLLRESVSVSRSLRDEATRILATKHTAPAIITSRILSPLHRRVPLSLIVLPLASGEAVLLCGLFTSRAATQECQTIPVLKEKFEEIINLEHFNNNAHDRKGVASIIDSLPKEDAFALSTTQLREIVSAVLDVGSSSDSTVTVWSSPDSSTISAVCFQLQSLYQPSTKEEFIEHLRTRFRSEPFVSELHLDITNRAVVRLYARCVVSDGSVNLEELRHELKLLARSWNGDLEAHLLARGIPNVAALKTKYRDAFPADYRTLQSVEDCIGDIMAMERLSAGQGIAVSLANFDPREPHKATLVVTSENRELTISATVPALESFGFEIINERTWKLRPADSGEVISSRYRVRTRSGVAINPETFQRIIALACTQTLAGTQEADPLNALMVEAEFTLRATSLMRAYCRLLWQVSKFTSRYSLMRAVAAYPHLATRLWHMFDLKFNPELKHSIEERKKAFATEAGVFIEGLRAVKDINADRVFRCLKGLLEHTVRTNFYRNDPSIALKLHSEAIDFFPQPRPLFEIFVSSPVVEGIHLRSGMVARGGIRWSDRPDDFRTEVLGLMKTQRVKNALIVPTGAKGGFIVKNQPSDSKLVPQAVEGAYREYIRALLSIADNRQGDAVVHPSNVLIYDKADPYFVVAADKGTATFSDTANSIATQEFNFWLGDAFASGGSNGYDHKLYAITAKGAWECVKRHFRDTGFEFETKPFSAIGIGDMAGDVFGNGLILSRQYKLIAAFNHKHIFIDPNPDPSVSFDERVRLFNKKGSQWSDYNPALMSAGGAIYDKFDKEIRLSPEARKSLGLAPSMPEVMTGSEVINAILKAPVDLMWNGGIGTYVKSSQQSNSDVGDSANDAVRVSAPELRARVIGEGGNLGFTQSGRIEFARLGGLLNTDAIDNSGGVDLSDHEVNLKILFSGLIRSKKLTVEDRNKILKEMSTEVCELVLDHNRSQALLLSLAERRSAQNMSYISRLLRELSRLGYINRALDNLPEEDALRERERSGVGLTRPELAVCMATVKMWIKDTILEGSLTESSITDDICLEYFPTAVQERFKAEALAHPLRRNIVATQLANAIVDTIGVTSLLKLSSRGSVSFATAVNSAIFAELTLNTRETRTWLLRNDATIGGKELLAMSQRLAAALGQMTTWFINRYPKGEISQAQLTASAKAFQNVLAGELTGIPQQLAQELGLESNRLQKLGVPQHSARLLAVCSEIVTVVESLWIAEQSGRSFAVAGEQYLATMQSLGADKVLRLLGNYQPADRWESELLPGLALDLRHTVAATVIELLKKSGSQGAAQTSPLPEPVARLVEELGKTPAKAASLAVIARQIKAIVARSGEDTGNK